MEIVKRDGKIVEFDVDKIKNAISKANLVTNEMSESDIDFITSLVLEAIEIRKKDNIEVETIQDIVEEKLKANGFEKTSNDYHSYREKRSRIRESKSKLITDLSELLDGTSDYWNNENSNKNAKVVTTQRDYIAGITSTEISRTSLLPEDIVEAHDKGLLHFHDMDYFAQASLYNCCLINLEDMLQNGTKINGVQIDKPHWLSKATTIATQIITAVASSQYGLKI